MVLGLAGLAAGGAGGLNPTSAASAQGGAATSGRNVISVGSTSPNLEAVINAVQGGGSSMVGGSTIRQPNRLSPADQTSEINFRLPGFDAGLTVNPLLIVAAAAVGVLIIPRLLKR